MQNHVLLRFTWYSWIFGGILLLTVTNNVSMTLYVPFNAGLAAWDMGPMTEASGMSYMDCVILLFCLAVPLSGNVVAMVLIRRNYR